MRYQTSLMRSILTDETAQRIIDYVSQIYGESYVGLWVFQAIGAALSDVQGIAESLRAETNPSTSRELLAYWEEWYGIPTDPSLTIEQRQLQLQSAISTKANMNPSRLAAAVTSALGGARCRVSENPGEYTFTIQVLDGIPSVDAARETIRQLKPAHLLAQIIFRYLHIDEIHEVKTLTEMNALTLDNFEG